MQFRRQDMRWRLQLWHMLIIFSLIAAALVFFYNYEKSSRLRVLDDSLQLPLIRIGPHFFGTMRHKRIVKEQEALQMGEALEEGSKAAKWLDGNRKSKSSVGRNYAEVVAYDALNELEREGFFAIVWSWMDGKVAYATDGAPVRESAPAYDLELNRPYLQWHNDHREAIFGDAIGNVILIGFPIEKLNSDLAQLRLELTVVGLIGFVSAGLLGWYSNSRALRPIKVMSESARAISDGNLSHRIDIGGSGNELGDLADVLNLTFERLEAALVRQMQFTADASHELRTPLTIILNEVGWALERERSLEESVESLETCQTSALHMKSLIESLLELARIDSGHGKLQLESLSLDQHVTQAVETLRPMAEQRKVKLSIETEPVEVNADPTQVRQVIMNLVSNAIHHTPMGSIVQVVVGSEAEKHLVRVCDNGGGIKETNIPFIFDRFYRSGQSRAKTVGSGLGLAISKAIAVAHGGDLTVVSNEDEGSVFTFILPASS